MTKPQTRNASKKGTGAGSPRVGRTRAAAVGRGEGPAREPQDLRTLAASLFTAQEEERRRVSRELHDDLAQKVALLELHTERLQQGMADAPESARTTLLQVRRIITELSKDLRRIAHQLHPSMLDDLGLKFALQTLCDELAGRERLAVRFISRNVPTSVPPVVGGALYRIAQEALRNIVEHAGQTRVEIRLRGTDRELRLQVRDHGSGFAPDAPPGRRGTGLLNMEERARMAGGTFSLTAAPGEGVTITVRVPLKKEEAR